ncbi:hypothetical protein J4E83_001758 [Alternaria metachromatica]|uniref:uncharacterized protein n=1 Tax=Alternaria metachromatica TaxID=283354 RepID=UPI0020C310E0|nr:uncharacterized protein J4E83_001758 [Alternaria metachromatica]KAI4634440.1 hypothetical protein J4E83_001758 [Alternaria metachromatica]
MADKPLLLEFLKAQDALREPPAMVTFLHRLPNSGDVAQAKLCRDLVFERSAKIAQQCKTIREDKVDMRSRPPGLISDYIVLLRDNKPPRRQFPTAGDQTMNAVARLRYITLSSLYLFSVEMEDSTSAQIVFRAIVDNFHFIWPNGFRYHPGSDVINHVYYYTRAWDPLRYFLADCYVDFANIKWYIPHRKFHKDFMTNVSLGHSRRRNLAHGPSRTANPRNYIFPQQLAQTATNSARKSNQ